MAGQGGMATWGEVVLCQSAESQAKGVRSMVEVVGCQSTLVDFVLVTGRTQGWSWWR